MKASTPLYQKLKLSLCNSSVLTHTLCYLQTLGNEIQVLLKFIRPQLDQDSIHNRTSSSKSDQIIIVD